ncbi:hypothetical protein EVJ58_g6837 [Rhodofomes roseus]|uniref:IRG-type G domain-containing protein n=1 Tax=Rhodofomes roseus TaxID=34475 RepID=A0A4Y9Y859_9APHY|nr:hypothetical protein EVJ58_g6837 [Rhodofomes roseus]
MEPDAHEVLDFALGAAVLIATSVCNIATTAQRRMRQGSNRQTRNRDAAALQRRLDEQATRLNEINDRNAAAIESYQNIQRQLHESEMALANVNDNRRLYAQDPYPIHDSRKAAHADVDLTRSVEADYRVAEDQRRRAGVQTRQAKYENWEAERQKREAEEDVRRAIEERERAVVAVGAARQEQEQALQALQGANAIASRTLIEQEEAENNLRQGIRPVIVPTTDESRAARERLGYEEGKFHVAIAGIAGSGKTSLVNAFRGLRNSDRDAAPTGVVETTSTIQRYPDPMPKRPIVWYDVPGAGTLSVPDWQYFTDQGLYALDCIIVLFDVRLTSTDIDILRDCARFGIPAYIVRSKALQHIRNLANDMPDTDTDEDEDEDDGGAGARGRAREYYIQETRASVAQNLDAADLPEQRIYLVDKDSLAKVVKGRLANDEIDETKLLDDVFAEAHRRLGAVET